MVVTSLKIMWDPIIQLWVGKGTLVTYITAEDSTDMTITVIYLLTPWSTVLLEKLTGSAASQEIPLITVPTSARHLSLS